MVGRSFLRSMSLLGMLLLREHLREMAVSPVVDLARFVRRRLTPPSPELITGRYRLLAPGTLMLPVGLEPGERILAEVECESMLVWVTNGRLCVQVGTEVESGWWSELERFTPPQKLVSQPRAGGPVEVKLIPTAEATFRNRSPLQLDTKENECGFLYSLATIGGWVHHQLSEMKRQPEQIGVLEHPSRQSK